jgi:hypothetical protein
MPIYRNIKYIKDKDLLWKILINNSIFIVALDDSKTNGNRKIIKSKNNEKTCKKFIDWLIQK